MTQQQGKTPVYESAYERARYEVNRSRWYIIFSAIPWAMFAYAAFFFSWWHLDAGKIAAVAAAMLALEAISLTLSLMSIGVLQMMQVEERRLDHTRLVSALASLEAELRDRPDVPNAVNWSLLTLKI